MDISSPARNAKNSKIELEQNFDEGRDRVCSLPDVLLHYILSYLPTKDAVRTCILSKRWQFMWTFITNFDFEAQVYMVEANDERTNFMNFVERVLLLSKSLNIDKFSLCCKVLSDEFRINSWVSAAVSRKVQRLTLHFPRELEERSIMLPHCLFTCESLKELHIDSESNLKLPSYICFLSLKLLKLENITFPDEHFAQQPFSACPNLTQLILYSCDWKNVKAVHISAPMLENVEINEIVYVGTGTSCQFLIPGMNLRSFQYFGTLEDDLCIFDAPKLDRAVISVPTIDYIQHEGRLKVAAYRGFKLLMGLANVKVLEVSHVTFQLLARAGEELLSHLPTFYNLKHLALDRYWQPGVFACRGLMKMLQNSPHLESLHFITGMKVCTYHDKNEWTFDPVPPCFLTHLKTIEFYVFNGSDEEVHLVKSLLRTASVLEKLSIRSNVGAKVHYLLLALPKGSVNCDVVFY